MDSGKLLTGRMVPLQTACSYREPTGSTTKYRVHSGGLPSLRPAHIGDPPRWLNDYSVRWLDFKQAVLRGTPILHNLIDHYVHVR